MNRHFQYKHAKYSNFCIINVTEAIPTKVCTVIKTTNYSMYFPKFLPHKSKMADGLHLENRINGCFDRF